MDTDLLTSAATAWVVAAVACLLAVGCAVASVRSRSRSRAALEQVLAATEELRGQVDELRGPAAAGGEPAPPRPRRPRAEDLTAYVITDAGREPDRGDAGGPEGRTGGAQPEGRIDGRLFADLVLREGAVRAGTLAHGLRRALAPETRNRIRFEMGREVKRARRHRRAQVREARRRVAAEERATVGGERHPGTLREGAA